MGLWDLSGATIDGQHHLWVAAAPLLKAEKRPEIVRLVDAAVALAGTGLSVTDSEGRRYLGFSKNFKALFTPCRSLAQQLPESCNERRSVLDKMATPSGESHCGLGERILDGIAALVRCDSKVTPAQDSDTTDLGLETPEGNPFYVTTGEGASPEMREDERLETAEQLAELVREAVELAGDIYDATVASAPPPLRSSTTTAPQTRRK
jgi:hypothetical protein